MAVSTDKRASTRIHTRFETAYRVEEKEGLGVLSDLSSSGARLEHCSWAPDLGAAVELRVQLHEHREPLELRGRVVRATQAGFVVGFEKHQEELERALDELELPLDDLMGPDLLSDEPAPPHAPTSAVKLERYSVAELEALSARIDAELKRKRR